MFMKKAVAAVTLLFTCAGFAAENPFQVSVPDLNQPEGDVAGVRLAMVYGQTNYVEGLNVSVLGLSDVNQLTGVGLSIIGAQRVREDFFGVSLSLANWLDNAGEGGLIGFANYTENDFTGVQLGMVNYAGTLEGVQIGWFNGTDRLVKGAQIGLLNFERQGTFIGPDVPVFPLINARF